MRHQHLGLLHAPNVGFAQSEARDGVRRFHLVVDEVQQELVKGTTVQVWGYNGSTPGPVLVVYEGERVQVVVHNRLPEPTSIHWHGLVVPNEMDGVPGIGAGTEIAPNHSFTFDFVVRQKGTYMYHSHVNNAKQEMMGLAGMLISLPRHKPTVDHDYVYLLQEWHVKEGTQQIDPMSMDFNYFTMNGKSYPATNPIRVQYGERIRIRLGNLSMNSHPMHLHGHRFQVVATDGNTLPQPIWKDKINVAPGETWDIEFEANNPGHWAFHCYKPHHMMNQHHGSLGGMFTVAQYESVQEDTL